MAYHKSYYSQIFHQSLFISGPKLILFQLKSLLDQNKIVRDIVDPCIQRSSYYAHSEMIIHNLHCSPLRGERKFAVQKIKTIRSKYSKEDGSSRKRKIPSINFNATSVKQLIDWKNEEIFEPPLSMDLVTEDLQKIIDEPMKVPKWPVHGQSIERCVKMVTEASQKVFTFEKRDGYIKSQIIHRSILAKNDSKNDMIHILSDREENKDSDD